MTSSLWQSFSSRWTPACFWGLCLLALTLMISPARAQFSSTIEGLVTDPSGGVVPDASVKIMNVETGVVHNTKTTQAGLYRMASLPAGNYRIAVSKEGFNTVIQENVVLEVARVQNVAITLKV